MKRVERATEPPEFTAWRADHPQETWKKFCDECHGEGGIKNQVWHALERAQGGICAYCEMKLQAPLGAEVEHVYLKERCHPAYNYGLDFGNFLAACEGGTKDWLKDESTGRLRSPPPSRKNRHCGSVKGNALWYADPAVASSVDLLFDPRKIPESPCLWRISPRDGSLEPDEVAIEAAGCSVGMAKETVTKLCLNAPVLRDFRLAVITQLDQELLEKGEGDREKEDALRRQMMVEYLGTDTGGDLRPFWTTLRAHLSPQN